MAKCTVAELKKFFESDGGRKVTSAELMTLKKNPSDPTAPLPDYDQIAVGIGDGTLNY